MDPSHLPKSSAAVRGGGSLMSLRISMGTYATIYKAPDMHARYIIFWGTPHIVVLISWYVTTSSKIAQFWYATSKIPLTSLSVTFQGLEEKSQ